MSSTVANWGGRASKQKLGEHGINCTKCKLNKCAYKINQFNNVSIEHNLALFETIWGQINLHPLSSDTKLSAKPRSKSQCIQAKIDPNHNESKL